MSWERSHWARYVAIATLRSKRAYDLAIRGQRRLVQSEWSDVRERDLAPLRDAGRRTAREYGNGMWACDPRPLMPSATSSATRSSGCVQFAKSAARGGGLAPGVEQLPVHSAAGRRR
jgi:hypothetical protein